MRVLSFVLRHIFIPGKLRLSDRHVLAICKDVGSCWQDLGKKVKLLDTTLRKIDSHYNRSREKAREMLRTWMKNEADNATVKSLANALDEIGKGNIVKKHNGM